MVQAEIDYQHMVQEALRGVVRQVLIGAASAGLSGDHHLYIAFATGEPGVVLSPQLRARHPAEMTIVLQHQFSNLEVREQDFSVTLSFSGKPERLTVPFAAITSFLDPSVPFGLQWKSGDPEAGDDKAESAGEKTGQETAEAAASPPAEAADAANKAPAKVIELDVFRKK